MFNFIKNSALSLMAAAVLVPALALAGGSTASVTQLSFDVEAEPGDKNVRVMTVNVRPSLAEYGAMEVKGMTIKCNGAKTLTTASVYHENQEIGEERFLIGVSSQTAVIDIDDTLVVSTGQELFEVKVDVGVKSSNYSTSCVVSDIIIERLETQAILGEDRIYFDTINASNELTVESDDFDDVDYWTDYYSSIEWMVDNGIVNGYSDGSFRPDVCVNRAEFLKVLMLTSGLDTNDFNDAHGWLFWDTPYNAWYVQYLKAGIAKGVIKGYPDGSFRPQLCVNRAEAIKMAVIEMFGYYPYAAYAYQKPVDVDSNAWYSKYVAFALSTNTVGTNHMFAGRNGTYFVPEGVMTRKEVAEMLYRMKTLKDNNLAYFYPHYVPGV